jgi:hypothetical protein
MWLRLLPRRAGVSKGLPHCSSSRKRYALSFRDGRRWSESDRRGTFPPILTVSHNQTPSSAQTLSTIAACR